MTMKEQKIGVLGFGEIGKAMAQFYPKVYVRDLDRNEFVKGLEVLHVCIPYSKNFVKIVLENIKEYSPELVIIHSTLPLGTTEKIVKVHKFTVHSPCRGVHPNLFEGIKTFTKYIGADFAGSGRLASEHLESLGIKTEVLRGTKTSEALKLWETTQYGWFIILEKEIHKWCEENSIPFDRVYFNANLSYNEGYWALGRYDVIRPTLQHIDGEIGGHCVINNCKLLDSSISEIILEKNETYAERNKGISKGAQIS